jgi:CHAT domain-containing protein
VLEAREIMQMDLKADLVVLSACETARGHISAGEGVIGLTWALFVAGTPTSVVSQWEVDSASTATLMLAFHRALKSEPLESGSTFTTARAMQRAELQLLRSPQYAHPFYWAGFVVVGDPH